MAPTKSESKKRGKKSWIFGTKLAFFASQKSEWEKSSRARNNKEWGRAMTVKYYIRYGDMGPTDDLKEEPSMPTADEVQAWEEAHTAKISAMSKEDADKCEEEQKALTKTILAWYRYTYKTSKPEDDKLFSDMVNQIHGRKDKPRRLQQVQMYTSVNWDFGLKDAINTEYHRVVAEAEEAHKKALETDPNTVRAVHETFLSVSRRIAQAKWDKESEDVKNNIKGMVERKLVEDMASYKALHDLTPSPELYQNALERGAAYLQRIVDTMSSTMGLTCTILLCGPMAEKGGRIEVRSLHSGVTRGGGLKWNEEDPAGFAEIEKCMVRFASKVFSEAECASRALQDVPLETDEGNNTAPPDKPNKSSPIQPPPVLPPTSTPNKSTDTVTAGKSVEEPAKAVEEPAKAVEEPAKAVEDLVQQSRCTTPPPQPPPEPVTPPLRSHQILNEELAALLRLLPDTERRLCMQRLRKMSDYEFDQQKLIAHAHAGLVNIVSNTPLNPISIISQYLPKRREANPWKQLLNGAKEDTTREQGGKEEDEVGHHVEDPSEEHVSKVGDEHDPKASDEHDPKASDEHDPKASDEHDPKAGDEASKEHDPRASDEHVPKASDDVLQPDDDHVVEPDDARRQEEDEDKGDRNSQGTPDIVNDMDVDEELNSDIAELSWDKVDSAKWWPELHSAFEAFKRGSGWGTLWTALVDSLLVFEEKAGFVDDPRNTLGTNHRPAIVAEFMKERRNYAKARRIDSLEELKLTFWRWWKSLQPSARLSGNDLTQPASIIEWNGLQDKSGRNGIILVIAVLFWWRETIGDGVEADSVELEDWALAVRDVTWALDNIIRTASFRRVSKMKPASIQGSGTPSSRNTRKRGQSDPDGKENAPPAKKSRRN